MVKRNWTDGEIDGIAEYYGWAHCERSIDDERYLVYNLSADEPDPIRGWMFVTDDQVSQWMLYNHGINRPRQAETPERGEG